MLSLGHTFREQRKLELAVGFYRSVSPPRGPTPPLAPARLRCRRGLLRRISSAAYGLALHHRLALRMLPGSGEALINYYYTKNQVGHSSIPLTGSAEGLRRVGRMSLGRALSFVSGQSCATAGHCKRYGCLAVRVLTSMPYSLPGADSLRFVAASGLVGPALARDAHQAQFGGGGKALRSPPPRAARSGPMYTCHPRHVGTVSHPTHCTLQPSGNRCDLRPLQCNMHQQCRVLSTRSMQADWHSVFEALQLKLGKKTTISPYFSLLSPFSPEHMKAIAISYCRRIYTLHSMLLGR